MGLFLVFLPTDLYFYSCVNPKQQFESMEFKSSNFILFQNYLAVLDPLNSYTHIRIYFFLCPFIFLKKVIGYCLEDFFCHLQEYCS